MHFISPVCFFRNPLTSKQRYCTLIRFLFYSIIFSFFLSLLKPKADSYELHPFFFGLEFWNLILISFTRAMDTTSAAATAATFKIVRVLASSTTRRTAKPTTLISPGASTRPGMLALCTCGITGTGTVFLRQKCPSPIPRNGFPYLTRCSTKPDIGSDNTTDRNPTVDTGSTSTTQQPSTPAQIQTPTSSSSSTGLVFDLGSNSCWDSREVGSPVVKRYLSDDAERWYMWYHGSSDDNPTSGSIGLAVSGNGIHWERGTGHVRSSTDAGMVMNCSNDWWAFDTACIRPSEVVIMSSTKVRGSNAVYWLYYTGFNSEKVDFSVAPGITVENPERVYKNDNEDTQGSILKSLPGLAISQDGRHWARIEGEHHSGALFDVGSGVEWDSLFVATPRVVFHSNGDLRMYYHSFDAGCGHFAVGIARSRDGIRWVKLGKIMGGGLDGSFDECGVINAHVVRNRRDGGYLMAYEGIAADGQRSIGLAVSPDGLKDWRRCGEDAVLKPSADEDGWDNKGVGSPCLVQLEGSPDEWRLYYRGVGKGGRTGIGMAVSDGSEARNFKRWTGFHV
uniref:Uncharacterized protein n=1 Tax=Nelumbo nucifera TaxID=4432 RepID=A0A822YQQ1_NELNU|nr:TPA_asm: hypothetical protein HUJ06_005552 [Nelumbo nucifera]